MSENDDSARSSILEVVVWCIAAPILSVWTLLSFLPAVSLIRAWGDVGQVLIASAFFVTGAVGLVAAVAGYRFLLWDERSGKIASSGTRSLRVVALSAYATVWMALYAL